MYVEYMYGSKSKSRKTGSSKGEEVHVGGGVGVGTVRYSRKSDWAE